MPIFGNTPPTTDTWQATPAGMGFNFLRAMLTPASGRPSGPPRRPQPPAPRTFSSDMNSAIGKAALTGLFGTRGPFGLSTGVLNPINSVLAANDLINGTIHAATGPVGAALYKHGIEATTLPEALQRGMAAIPATLVNPNMAAMQVPRILFKHRQGAETAQGLARTQDRTELAGQGAFMAATAPLGGEAEAPMAVEEFGPEMGNILARIGNRMSNGAGVSADAAHNQALAYIFQGLKKDGGTPQQLADVVQKWQAAGSDAPSFFDALSELPGGGQNTKRVILDAIPRNADAANTTEQYARVVGTQMKPRTLNAVRTLKPQGSSINNLETAANAAQAAGAPDADLANRVTAGQYARNNAVTTDGTGFWDGMPDFMKPSDVDGVTVDPLATQGEGTLNNAMQAGAYDGLYQAVNSGRRPAADLLDDLAPGGHTIDTLQGVFGEKVDGFAQRIGNEVARNSNAVKLNRGFDPFAASRPDGSLGVAGANGLQTVAPGGPVSQAVVGAGLRQLFPGTLKTDAELANIAKIATGSAQDVASLPPRVRMVQPLPPQAYTLPAAVAHLASLPSLTDGPGGSQAADPGPAQTPPQPAPQDMSQSTAQALTQSNPSSAPPAPDDAATQPSSAQWPPFALWQ